MTKDLDLKPSNFNLTRSIWNLIKVSETKDTAIKRVSKTTQAIKEKASLVKDCVASTLGASNEKPHKDDETRKDEAQYDVG